MLYLNYVGNRGCHIQWLLDGAFEDVYLQTINTCCYSHDTLQTLGIADGGPRGEKNARLLWRYMCELLSNKAIRELPQLFQYPHFAAAVIVTEGTSKTERRADALRHAQHVWAIDAILANDPTSQWAVVVREIWWWDHAFPRLFFNLIEREEVQGGFSG